MIKYERTTISAYNANVPGAGLPEHSTISEATYKAQISMDKNSGATIKCENGLTIVTLAGVKLGAYKPIEVFQIWG